MSARLFLSIGIVALQLADASQCTWSFTTADAKITRTITGMDDPQCCLAVKKNPATTPGCLKGRTIDEDYSVGGAGCDGAACKVDTAAAGITSMDYYGLSDAWCTFLKDRTPPMPPGASPSAYCVNTVSTVGSEAEVASSVSVQPQDLAHWLSSKDGLSMSASDAAKLADKTYTALTGSGVIVSTLQAMKDKMFTKYPKGMGLDLSTIQSNIFKLVEQHIDPDNLFKLFCHLYEGYTSYGGLDLPMSEAQTRAIPIALQRTDPDNLYYLYKVMYGYGGLGFKQDVARTQAVQEAIAGADPDVFKESYTKSPDLQGAIKSSVDGYLQSLAKRYAKDGKLYTAKDFQDYYPSDWLAEWTAAPMEKKVSSDKKAYTAGSFSRHYGSSWAAKWRTCDTATQVRLAEDGNQYTLVEFQQYYKTSWQQKFADAPELACKECTPYDDAALAGDLVV